MTCRGSTSRSYAESLGNEWTRRTTDCWFDPKNEYANYFWSPCTNINTRLTGGGKRRCTKGRRPAWRSFKTARRFRNRELRENNPRVYVVGRRRRTSAAINTRDGRSAPVEFLHDSRFRHLFGRTLRVRHRRNPVGVTQTRRYVFEFVGFFRIFVLHYLRMDAFTIFTV